jgi:hypothetical protein
MKRAGHADLDAQGAAAAQIALERHLMQAVDLDTAERASRHTQAATHTAALVHHNGMGFRIPGQRSGGANLHASGALALAAGDRGNTPMIHVHMDHDVGCPALKDFRLMKGADPLAAPAGDAPVGIDIDDVH